MEQFNPSSQIHGNIEKLEPQKPRKWFLQEMKIIWKPFSYPSPPSETKVTKSDEECDRQECDRQRCLSLSNRVLYS